MPREYKLIAGQTNKKFRTVRECLKKYAEFSPLITALAKCLKANSLKIGELKFSQEGEKLNLKFFNDKKGKGKILIEVMESADNFLGEPYYSSWDGLFYRLPRNKKKPFAKNGQFVKGGNPIGIIFINKNEQFVLNVPESGFIYFPEEDRHLDRGRPIKVYDQTDSDDNKPIFYLK